MAANSYVSFYCRLSILVADLEKNKRVAGLVPRAGWTRNAGIQ